MLAISVLRWARGITIASGKSLKSEIKTLNRVPGVFTMVPSSCQLDAAQRFNALKVTKILCQWVPRQNNLSQRRQTKNSSSQR